MDMKEAAAALGRLGGLKKSERKAAACRANGKLARRKKPVPEPQLLTAAPVDAQPAPQPARPAAFLVVPK
jgi:hypothetical protein